MWFDDHIPFVLAKAGRHGCRQFKKVCEVRRVATRNTSNFVRFIALPTSIGVDIVEIDRIRKLVETRGERFLGKVYAPGEVTFCSKRADRAACLAARFAAKEAFKKAIAAGVGLAWREIVVASGSDGSPRVELPAEVRKKLAGTFSLSLSHSRDYAVAVVLWERA